MNLYVPAPFPYATPLSAFIFPFVSIVSIVYFACAFISVYATHIVPLPLSCNHYFHSTCPACPYKPCPACPYKPLLSLYHSGSPAPLLLFFPVFYLLMPVFFYPITNILPLMPPLPRFLFPFPLSFLFPFLLFFWAQTCPMKMKTGKTLRSQVRCPTLPTHSVVLKR